MSNGSNLLVMFFNNRIMKSFGKYSFGIYLLHSSVIYLLQFNHYLIYSRLRVIAIVLVSYLFGFIFYHVLEKHLISLANLICVKLETLFKQNQSKSFYL